MSRSSERSSFKVGDNVRIITPMPERGQIGVVAEVLEPHGDRVFRYRVRFADGNVKKFFRFELELVEQGPADVEKVG